MSTIINTEIDRDLTGAVDGRYSKECDVIQAVSTPSDATGGTRELRLDYRIDPARDVPGAWRVELALDGSVVAARDIDVAAE